MTTLIDCYDSSDDIVFETESKSQPLSKRPKHTRRNKRTNRPQTPEQIMEQYSKKDQEFVRDILETLEKKAFKQVNTCPLCNFKSKAKKGIRLINHLNGGACDCKIEEFKSITTDTIFIKLVNDAYLKMYKYIGASVYSPVVPVVPIKFTNQCDILTDSESEREDEDEDEDTDIATQRYSIIFKSYSYLF